MMHLMLSWNIPASDIKASDIKKCKQTFYPLRQAVVALIVRLMMNLHHPVTVAFDRAGGSRGVNAVDMDLNQQFSVGCGDTIIHAKADKLRVDILTGHSYARRTVSVYPARHFKPAAAATYRKRCTEAIKFRPQRAEKWLFAKCYVIFWGQTFYIMIISYYFCVRVSKCKFTDFS